MKITLDQTYIYEGQFYGPGEIDAPKEVAVALKARMAELNPKPEEESPETKADA